VTARGLFFALSVGACALAGAADPADLCADSRIPKPMVQRADACTTQVFPLERPGGMTSATLVTLIDGVKYAGGGYGAGGTIIHRYFLRTPEDRILTLGDPPQIHSLETRLAILRALGIEPGYAGGLDGIAENDLYTRVFREDPKRGVCVIYRMRAPLRGEILDCEGHPASGEASYAPGTTTWRQAYAVACGRMGGVNCDLKEARAIRILRGPDGALHYEVEFVAGARLRVSAGGKIER
jgi:hypothetical protein